VPLAGLVAGLVGAPVACSSSPPGRLALAWSRPDASVFSAADLTATLPGGGSDPWLVGGSSGGAVAIWWAAGVRGPWHRATFTAVTNDGPLDTILGLARTGAVSVALGSHGSPIHGIPRPSPWMSADGGRSWSEVPTLRELFGGENIVGLGALTAGPHGFFVAGTWVATDNRSVATVWQSPDGRRWARDDHDPSLAGSPGELTMAEAVGDRADGLVAVGSALVPTPAAPAAQRGAVWQSADGAAWSRLDAGAPSLGAGPGQVQVERAAATAGGWVAAGVSSVGGRAQVVVWTWRPGGELAATALPSPAITGNVAVGGLAVTASSVVVAAAVDGAPALWLAPLSAAGRPGRWRPVSPPPGPLPPGLRTVALADDGTAVAVVIRGATGSQLWVATLA
jgi:hypothetical protein